MIAGFAKVRRTYRVTLLGASTVCEGAAPAQTPNWTGSFVARIEALALLQTLNADLLSHDSATLTLERWCDVHRLASPPRIVAARDPDVDKQPTPEQRRELAITATDPVRYLRVKLMCGAPVLSDPHTLYLPAPFTPHTT